MRLLDVLIEACRKKHNNVYQYDLSDLTQYPKIKIICPHHGEFVQNIYRHKSETKCPTCARIKRAQGHRIPYDTWVKRCSEKHDNKYTYNPVDNFALSDYQTITCPHHGDFLQTGAAHLSGQGCPHAECVSQKISESKTFDKSEVIEKCKQIHNNKYDYSLTDWKKLTDEVKIICPVHGEFKQQMHRHYRGCGCIKCVHENTSLNYTYTKELFVEKMIEKYGDIFDFTDTKYVSSYEPVTLRCKTHDHSFDCVPNSALSKRRFNVCPKCIYDAGHSGISNIENVLFEEFKDLFEQSNKTVLNGKELDMYSEEHKLAVEVNGVYWHSDKFKERDHLLDKTLECEKSDITLLHFWDYEIDKKFDIVKSMVSSRLGLNQRIYARKCVIREVSSKESKQFQIDNHLQGYTNAKINYGLYHNDELVALMTFSKSRFDKKYDFELIRYCNKLDLTIVGGASKLLKHFQRNHKGSIVSYANRRYSNGNLYRQLGFNYKSSSVPNYWYSSGLNLLSRYECQKHKLKNVLKNFDESLSERDNMVNNGYYRIYDCGNDKFELVG